MAYRRAIELKTLRAELVEGSLKTCWGRSTGENLPPHRKKLTNTSRKRTATLEAGAGAGRVQHPPEPEVQFDLMELQLKEVREVVHKARARSATGPSGTSYKVYKNYPKLLLRLWKILQIFWRKGKIP
ncbi:hypothetical protein SRHO_G00025900 [Serrasalmus rhombeus]